METVMNISNVKTHPKTDKPYDDITIISINVKNVKPTNEDGTSING